jgi:hypothetical protein
MAPTDLLTVEFEAEITEQVGTLGERAETVTLTHRYHPDDLDVGAALLADDPVEFFDRGLGKERHSADDRNGWAVGLEDTGGRSVTVYDSGHLAVDASVAARTLYRTIYESGGGIGDATVSLVATGRTGKAGPRLMWAYIRRVAEVEPSTASLHKGLFPDPDDGQGVAEYLQPDR